MLATNPAMLKAGEPVPANWTAAPDLNSFVVDNSAESASIGPASSTASGSGSAESGALPSGDAQAEGANSTTSGAGRVGFSLGAIALVGLGLGALL